MPELPEVETMRRGVLVVQDAIIASAERTPCGKRPITITPRIDHFNRRVQGKKIVAVERLGKRVVLRLDSGDRIIFEPRMTGLVLVGDPPGLEHLRFSLTLNKCPISQLLFWDRRGLGKVLLLSEKDFQEDLMSGRLGPDALDVSSSELRDRFSGTQREIKVALLDQARLAGIGNLYASEILHLAKISPKRRCHKITKAEWERIHQFMLEVLEAAIENEGSTLSDGTYRNALNDPGGYQHHHLVYDQEGETCKACRDSKIKRIVQAQRATFYCPKCQKR